MLVIAQNMPIDKCFMTYYVFPPFLKKEDQNGKPKFGMKTTSENEISVTKVKDNGQK